MKVFACSNHKNAQIKDGFMYVKDEPDAEVEAEVVAER